MGSPRRSAPPLVLTGLLLFLLLAFLILALGWHLIGMDHREPMGFLGACSVVLVASFLLLAPRGTVAIGRLRNDTRMGFDSPAGQRRSEPPARSPPLNESLGGVVLLC